jgi:predicted PurR-regulated permease PerM
MSTSVQDIPRITLAVLFIGGLIVASLWILWPFLPALIWATMIVVAMWPVLLQVQGWLWGRRPLAVIVMTVALLLVFVVPLSLAISTIVANADQIVSWAESLGMVTLPLPPAWIQTLPLIGDRAAHVWGDLAASGPEELTRKVAPYTGQLVRWFAQEVGSFGMMAVQFLLTVVMAAILFATGERVVADVCRFGGRLAGSQGKSAVVLAGQAIRGVALGVVVTAFVQSVMGGIGLAVAGVPFAAILTAIMFLLAVAQIGAVSIMLVGIGWLYWTGAAGWATGLLLWSILVGSLDNVLRPILIKRGADLPLLLILAGVIGGLIAFGLVGIFVGPVVLAVAYRLLDAWVGEELGEPPSIAEEAQHVGQDSKSVSRSPGNKLKPY